MHNKNVVVKRKTGVAMKSFCGLTTTQYGLQRKILSKAEITFASESSERKEQEHIVQDNIVVKTDISSFQMSRPPQDNPSKRHP